MVAVTKDPPQSGDYVWDGQDEAERPLTREEMLAAVESYRQYRDHPSGPETGEKEQVTIRFDRDVLEAFRGSGPGWQTRMNNALRDWLQRHSIA